MLGVGDAVWISVTGAFVAIVLLAVIIVALVMRREMRAELGSMKVTLGSVDRAVNQRPKGSSTISQDVAQMRTQLHALENIPAQVAALHEVVHALAGRVGALEEADELGHSL